jgi:hypothetical protein
VDQVTKVLARVLGHAAELLPAGRRDWAEAVLAEAGESPAGVARVAWLSGGLGLVAREILMGRTMRVLAFAVCAAGLAWVSWPGGSSNTAVPLNRMYAVGTVLLLAALPVVIRRYFGPVRPGWAPRAARIGGYALVLTLVAAKAVKDRLGSQLGAYFAIVPGEWAMEILLLLVIAAYVAGLLVLTSRRRVRLARWSLPAAIGLGAVTAGVLYAAGPFGTWASGLSFNLWWLGVALPVVTGFLAVRFSTRDKRPAALDPVLQGSLAATCATATAALLLAVLTSATVALLPHHVPSQNPPGGQNGVCQTCAQDRTVIPPRFRSEYRTQIAIGQAAMMPLTALMVAPFLGAWLGVLGAGLGRRSRGVSRRGVSGRRADGPQVLAQPQPSGSVLASDADRDKAVSTLTAAFAQGRLTAQELDVRAGAALAARTLAELAALTADLPAGLTRNQPARGPARRRPRQAVDKAVAWCAWGLVVPALLEIGNAMPKPTQTDNNQAGGIFFLVAAVYVFAWLGVGAMMLGTWQQQRSGHDLGGHVAEPTPQAP